MAACMALSMGARRLMAARAHHASTSASSTTTGEGLVLAAHLYVSEGRNDAVIQQLQSLARCVPRVVLANLFVDRPYNRTGLTLTSTSPQLLSQAVVGVASSAITQVDLCSHVATHPRLGVADHVSVQPISWGAALCARDIGTALSRHCPVYFYGAAHPSGRALADVRRSLGYFKPDASHGSGNLWEGPLALKTLEAFAPDMGGSQVRPQTGVATIGAVPFIVNYNVPLATSDFKQAQAIARAVSTRGGGLPFVEAMALHHSEGCIEVACNLLDPEVTTPSEVQRYIEGQAVQRQGLQVRPGYTTNKSAQELVELTLAALAQGR